MPKMPQFEVEARAITAAQSNSDAYPDWAEITLVLTSDDGRPGVKINLTRAAGEEILRTLHKVLHPWAGHSIKETIQEELDSVVGRLISDGRPANIEEAGNKKPIKQQQEDWKLYGEDRGQAQGLAYALAVIRNPYGPNVEAIRKEALERARDGED